MVKDDKCSGARCVEKAEAAMYYRDFAAAREPLSIVCKGGDGFQCFRLAELYKNGQGGPVDLEQAVAAYEASCKGKYGEGCERRADLAREGHGGPEVELEFTSKACELERPVACVRAGEQVLAARGVERDDIKAIELFQKGCRGGETIGCTHAGDLMSDPKHPPEFKNRALTAYVNGCVGHSGYGCMKAAIAFHEGIGTPRDTQRAKVHFEKACQFAEPDGCRLAEALTASNLEPVALALTNKAKELSQDGLELRAVSCRMSRLGPQALGEVIGEVADAKPALDACAKEGAAVGVTWEAADGRMRAAKVSDKVPPKLAKCVVAALRKVEVTSDAACEAVLLFGDAEGAIKALADRQVRLDAERGIVRKKVSSEDDAVE